MQILHKLLKKFIYAIDICIKMLYNERENKTTEQEE